jgi:hypothetical protein
MSGAGEDLQRLRQLIILGSGKPNLAELKKLVRHWSQRGATGQEGINRALVRAIDELHGRLDVLVRI